MSLERDRSEGDVCTVTYPLTDDDFYYFEDECAEWHYEIECNNDATIKSKPSMLKREREDLIEDNTFHTIVKDRFCDPNAQRDQKYSIRCNRN